MEKEKGFQKGEGKNGVAKRHFHNLSRQRGSDSLSVTFPCAAHLLHLLLPGDQLRSWATPAPLPSLLWTQRTCPERVPGISPVVVHDRYGQVDLVNALGGDVKDYGFVVNRIQGVPLGGRFPLLQPPAVTHHGDFHIGICGGHKKQGSVRTDADVGQQPPHCGVSWTVCAFPACGLELEEFH